MEVLKGVLSIKHEGVFKHKTLDQHCCILYHGVKELSPRIDIYAKDPQTNKGSSCIKTIYIESAAWKNIDALEPAFSFEVKHSKQYIFYCNSTLARREWILTLCCISEGLFDTKHVVGVSNEGVVSLSSIPVDEYSVVIENEVYGGASSVQSFFALADQSDGCLRKGWRGLFKLSIGLGCVKLFELNSNIQKGQWHLQELRNYGSSTQTMFVQAGSRASTGEGRFTFRTPECAKIIGVLGRETQLIQASKNGSAVASPEAGVTSVPLSQVQVVGPERNSNNNTKVTGPPRPNMAPPGNQSYMNVDVNGVGAKAPVGVTLSGASQSAPSEASVGARSNDFRRQLDSALEGRSAVGDERKQSVGTTLSNSSSGTTSKKADKKVLKQLKKEQEKKEKEEKKARKKREEEERNQRRRQEQALKKGARKKPEMSSGYSEPSQAELESVYAQADETEPPTPTRYSNEPENMYATAGDFHPLLPIPKEAALKEVKSDIYNEPWGINPLFSSAPPPEAPGDPDDPENIYSTPDRSNNNMRPRAPLNESLYEDTESQASGGQPPDIIPPIWDREGGRSSEDGNNVYARTNETQETSYEHVYGIGSASEEFNPHKPPVYAGTGTEAYESMNIPL